LHQRCTADKPGRVQYLLLLAVALSLFWLGRELLKIAQRALAVREQAQAPAQLEREVRKLEQLQPGGTADTPVEIPAPSVVEAHAGNRACARCEGAVDVLDHAVLEHQGERLRVARVRCRRCGHERALYFRLARTN